MASKRDRGWKVGHNFSAVPMARIVATLDVLKTYEAYLPMTLRQVFYVLVTREEIDKTEKAYKSFCETMVMARRAKLIDMSWIRDDGATTLEPGVMYGVNDMVTTWRDTIESFQGDRQEGQERRLVVWCEASGMAPMLYRATEEYGIPVVSSGGFDSLTTKYEMSQQLSGRTVLHLGDYDPSGVHMFSSLGEDIMAFADDVEFERIAVLPEQIEQYSLPTAPPKPTDKRSFDDHRTVQCEAFPPDILLEVLKGEIEDRLDMDVFQKALDDEEATKRELEDKLDMIED